MLLNKDIICGILLLQYIYSKRDIFIYFYTIFCLVLGSFNKKIIQQMALLLLEIHRLFQNIKKFREKRISKI